MDEQARATHAARYGESPRSHGRTRVVVLGALLLVAASWAIWVAMSQARQDVTWQVQRFETQPSAVVITFTLRRSGDYPVTCEFRARGRDGAEVGTGTLTIPISRRRTVSTQYTLSTSARPVTGEITGCERAADR